MHNVLGYVPDIVRKALQPIEAQVSDMATAVGSFSQLVAEVTVMESIIDQNRKDVASFAFRFSQMMDISTRLKGNLNKVYDEFEAKRYHMGSQDKVFEDMTNVGKCLPNVVKLALQPIETTLRDMTTAMACVPQIVAQVTTLEKNGEQNRHDVASFAMRFSQLMDITARGQSG